MQLKFEIIKKFNFGVNTLIDKIRDELINDNYTITNYKENIIEFKDDNSKLRSRSKYYSMVDNGRFIIESHNHETKLRYIYFISLNAEILGSIIIIFISFFVINDFRISFLFLPIIIQIVIKINTLNKSSNEFISKIIP